MRVLIFDKYLYFVFLFSSASLNLVSFQSFKHKAPLFMHHNNNNKLQGHACKSTRFKTSATENGIYVNRFHLEGQNEDFGAYHAAPNG